MQLADGLPHRCTHLVNLDGLPSRRNWPDVPDHERRRLMAGEMQNWLDHHAGSSVKERRPGTIDELAERRQRMNPRLTIGVAALPRSHRRAAGGRRRGRRR